MDTSGGSSLRPAWYKGTGGGGGRGFQPPPTIAADRIDQPRSSSWGSQERCDSNKFSALQDEEDEKSGSTQREDRNIANSRGEAFRTSFGRSSSGPKPSGPKPSGRSLADLAASVPENSSAARRHVSSYESRASGNTGRFSNLRSGENANPGNSASVDGYRPDPKVIRYTREKLLSMRPPSEFGDQSLPADLHPLEGSAVISKAPQDPVCWDSFDAEEIWEAIRDRRMPSGAKAAGGSSRGPTEASDEPRRRNTSTAGRWQRGVALPPPDEGGRRKDKDAESPDELWDDPLGGATGAASDFSAFGAFPDDDAFDFEKMAEASKKLEEELHGPKKSDDIDEEPYLVKVDPSRPLASAGMTLSSGSGDGVNVFEDFDSPSENEVAAESAPTVRAGKEDPNASSRLMKMIGVTRDPPENGNKSHQTSNPWGTSDNLAANATGLDPLMSIGGASSIPLNPWGIQAPTQQGELTNGNLNISPQLGSFSTEQRVRDEQTAAELEKRAHEVEMFRRQKEEEAQRRTHAQKQAEEQARQHVRANAIQQQAESQQSQVELVLMERICAILENSWGRSDLVSILTTLHSEDSRVIPLLGHVDALRALIARSPRRITLHRDPSFGGDIAVLAITNSQWQQQQLQARLEQEEIERRRIEEAEKNRVPATRIDPQAPWFYSDPQNNVQGPFRGDEMRQWLEAGYFKGDLPISQSPQGPFLPLSTLFPDSLVAFRAAVEEIEESSMKSTEAETARPEIAEDVLPDVSDAVVEEQASMDNKEGREIVEPKEDESGGESENVGNQSSAQLKMILGLSTDAPPVEDSEETESPKPEKPVESEKSNLEIVSKNSKKSEPANSEEPASEKPKQPSAAWGGATSTNPKKSMSEIQQEEARVAAMLERDNMPRQQSSGWANVAASGKSGWSSGTLKQSATITGMAQNGRQIPGRGKVQNTNQPSTQRKVTPGSQNQGFDSAQSSTPAEEFGTTMSPALEKWCKEQMQKISGGDDLTLVAFCMTLDDANEIRQYLTTYLGSTSQVDNFATEFINRRGLGMKQEEWETPGSARKGRKKKGGR